MAVGAGRRTIGQVAGHTIHLEIEEVSGRTKKRPDFENVERRGRHRGLFLLKQLSANDRQNCRLWVNYNTVCRFQNIKNVDLLSPPSLLMCILVLGFMNF